MSYKQHPLSSAFPAMAEDDFRALVDDIKKHGQRDPVALYEGFVIDGWHRYRACLEVGRACRFYNPEINDAVAFVRSKNQHRRHYMKSQQAAIEVALATWAEAHRPKKGEAASPFTTNKQMADRAGTTERTIQQAKRAHEAGLGDAVRDGVISAEKAAAIAADPELAKQVAHGEISLPKAVEQITGKRPGAKPEHEPVEDETAEDCFVDNLTMLRDSLNAINEENTSLKKQIANYEAILLDDERAGYLDRLNVLTKENKTLEILNRGLTEARDRVMRENVSLRKQAEYATKKLKALDRAAA